MSIKIGNYIIHAPHKGKVWIVNVVTGDGGSFPVEELAELVDKYFAEKF